MAAEVEAVVFVVPGIVLKVATPSAGGIGTNPEGSAIGVAWLDSNTFSELARSAMMSFSCCSKLRNRGSILDSSMTARRKIELMARCNVIQERAAWEDMLCISMYASTVVIRLPTQSRRMLAVMGSLVSTVDLSAGRPSSEAK